MKVVLVTGASGGIGEKICNTFKNKGWIVIGTSRSKIFQSAYIDCYISSDLSNETAPLKIIDQIKKEYGRLDCIINNAACQICKPIWEMESYEWDLIYNCNVKSIFLFAKHALELLKESKGNIINIGSVHSVVTSNEIAAYASSKAAIAGLTKNLAIELGQFGIRVNCIAPGAVDTQMLRAGLLRGHAGTGDSDTLVNNLGKSHLLGSVGSVDEIANFVEFVANDDNGRFINGANLLIDGGACVKLSTE
jgi:NAD(P)-dependent dehydrogenase (short-subunit alcohol dehydrogenase family)